MGFKKWHLASLSQICMRKHLQVRTGVTLNNGQKTEKAQEKGANYPAHNRGTSKKPWPGLIIWSLSAKGKRAVCLKVFRWFNTSSKMLVRVHRFSGDNPISFASVFEWVCVNRLFCPFCYYWSMTQNIHQSFTTSWGRGLEAGYLFWIAIPFARIKNVMRSRILQKVPYQLSLKSSSCCLLRISCTYHP